MDYQVQLNNGQAINLTNAEFDTSAFTATLNDQKINFVNIGGAIINKHIIVSVLRQKLHKQKRKQWLSVIFMPSTEICRGYFYTKIGAWSLMGGFNLDYLEVAHLYLFGGVKFLHLLLLLMGLDIITGVFKAIRMVTCGVVKAYLAMLVNY